MLSRLEPDFHGERRASAVTMPSLSDDRGPLSFYSRCRIYNSLISNSAVAFGVNTLEKEETDNGSLITEREGKNLIWKFLIHELYQNCHLSEDR